MTAYLAAVLWIGVRSARRVQSSTDYALAGRDVPWIILLATTAATMVGGGASVGMVAQVCEIGIVAAIVTCAWHLQLIFTGLFVAPRLRGLNLVTVGDYFHLKFGPLAREIAVANCVLFLVGALAAQMAAMGTVANTLLEVPYTAGLTIGAAVTIFYSTIGGIRAVVMTDVLQFVILIVGITVASAVLIAEQGGMEGLLAEAGESQFHVLGEWSVTRLISVFFAFLLGETFVPPYTVRCFIAADRRHARWGVAGAGIFLLVFLPISTFILGTSARVDPAVQTAIEIERQEILRAAAAAGRPISEEIARHQAYQIAFPTLVRATFPPLITGVIMAAIISAVMSSSDSCLSCLATVAMEDIYRRHINPAAGDRRLLRVAQAATLVLGAAAAVCASFVSNIADILVFVYDFWAPAMVLPFLVAVFWYHESRVYAVVASMIAGTLAAVLWRFGLGSPGDIGPALLGFGSSVLVFVVALPLTRRLPRGRLFRFEGEDSAGESP